MLQRELSRLFLFGNSIFPGVFRCSVANQYFIVSVVHFRLYVFNWIVLQVPRDPVHVMNVAPLFVMVNSGTSNF